MAASATGEAATSWTGVGAVVGGAAVIHGFDVTYHALSEVVTGEEQPTLIQQSVATGLSLAGMSKPTANTVAGFVDGSISIAITGGALSFRNLSDATSVKLPPIIPSAVKPGPKPFGYINLASAERTTHILVGDANGGGYAWFSSWKSFKNGITRTKSTFPHLGVRRK